MPSPPLPWLRTFEAAARHGSFARAAAELFVTPAAVSQQMRQLEERLGVTLFVRGARGLAVTPQGRDYAAEIGRLLEGVESATRSLRAPERAGVLTVATFHSFAMFWLLPRLPAFRARHPEIDVRLSLGLGLAPVGHDGVDAAIRFGQGRYPGLTVQRLMADFAVPVCAPGLLAGRAVPRRSADLIGLPLIVDSGLVTGERSLRWESWLGDQLAEHSRTVLPDGVLALHAALLGQGVALTRQSLVSRFFEEGRLVPLLDRTEPTDFSYWLVTPPGEPGPRTAAFARWLEEQVSS